MLVLKDHYNILCLGLCSSGKSTVLAQLVGESTSNIEPTKGFNIKTLPIKDTVVCIKEIGGSSEIQPFWDYYIDGKNALLFMVNAAGSDDELKIARDTLKSVLAKTSLRGKPCMILATHNDLANAKSEIELEQFFQNVIHGHKWRVQSCSSFDRKAVLTAIETLVDLMTK